MTKFDQAQKWWRQFYEAHPEAAYSLARYLHDLRSLTIQEDCNKKVVTIIAKQ